MSPSSWGPGFWPRREPRRPGPGPRRASGRKPFGATWWGKQWVEALEQRASLDPNRLPRGRTYAREGAVGDLHVTAGEVAAPVQGSRRTPYQVRVRVRQFSGREWDVVLDALAAQVGHAAALLEGELVPEVADDVRAVGLDLLPGAGEVQPRCSCPDWAEPCKHSAAVCYLVADELDRDPFVVFLIRGKGREELLAGMRKRRGVDGAGQTGVVSHAHPSLGDGWEDDAGVVAREAWSRREEPGPNAVFPDAVSLPAPLAVSLPAPPGMSLPAPPRHAGRPPLVLDVAPPGSGVDTNALRALAADAAARAWALATGGGPGGLELNFTEDCARWAASMIQATPSPSPSPVSLDELARRAGVARRDLFLRALAWKSGGRGGLAALLESWEPAPADLAPGRAALGPGARASANRVTLADRQLRLGRDGGWYPYRKVRGAWQPESEGAVVPTHG